MPRRGGEGTAKNKPTGPAPDPVQDAVESIRVYFNPDSITERDIYDEETNPE
jgi:hypothetical protein